MTQVNRQSIAPGHCPPTPSQFAPLIRPPSQGGQAKGANLGQRFTKRGFT
jgi:hypothetical protein